ncbi:hypothetical protein [Porphyromonas cangingivalis]|nr:hypothetical protein [Porphyromonas cangingivalis]
MKLKGLNPAPPASIKKDMGMTSVFSTKARRLSACIRVTVIVSTCCHSGL